MAPQPSNSATARILRPNEMPSISRGGGASTTPLVTADRGATSFLNGITRFAPDARIGHHIHNVAESVIVIDGTAIVDIDGVQTLLNTFDTTFVPANIPHHFRNASSTLSMSIFWTYGSLDSTRTMISTQQQGRIDAEHDGVDVRPVREMARIRVKSGHQDAFEAAVAVASPLFQQAPGARTFVLERSEEDGLNYVLFVGWNSVDDHMRFRDSIQFGAWRALVDDHMAAPPQVEHTRNVVTGF